MRPHTIPCLRIQSSDVCSCFTAPSLSEGVDGDAVCKLSIQL